MSDKQQVNERLLKILGLKDLEIDMLREQIMLLKTEISEKDSAHKENKNG